MRPCDGVPAMSGPKRTGLSQVTLSTLLLNVEPSQPMRSMPVSLPHSRAVCSSVVRVSTGTGSSTALLNPNEPPNGIAPSRVVFFTLSVMSVDRSKTNLTSAWPIFRVVRRSKRVA